MPTSVTEAEIGADVRSLLNDTAGQIFKNAVILPYVNIEYRKIPHAIIRKGLPLLRTWITTTLTAGSSKQITRATANFTVMVEPIAVLDRRSGSTDDWLPIHKIDDNAEFQNYLITQRFPANKPYGWNWADNQLTISGSMSGRDLNIQVYRDLAPLTLLSGYVISEVAIIDLRDYLTHRIAAICALEILRDVSRANELGQEAERILQEIHARFVKEHQDLPARQRRFQSRNKGYLVR